MRKPTTTQRSSRRCRRKHPAATWQPPESLDLSGIEPVPLDDGAVQFLSIRLTRKLDRLRRRSSLTGRAATVDAAIEEIQRALPALARMLAEHHDAERRGAA